MTRSTLTPEVRARIAARVELGASLRDAAQAVGVKYETARGWLRRGRREEEGRYREFATAIEEAREKAAARPEPMDEAELREHVEQAVRAGSVQAMKVWLDAFRPKEGNEDEDLGF